MTRWNKKSRHKWLRRKHMHIVFTHERQYFYITAGFVLTQAMI